MTETAPRRQRRFSLLADTTPLRTPAFRRLWLAGVVTVVGAQLSVVAVPKQIYDITGSSGYVGLTGVFGLVPLVVFGLWGGAIADAVDRRVLLIVTSAGIAVSSIALWVQAAVGSTNVWLVLGLFAVQQAFLAVNQPTRNAVIPRLLPIEQIPAANALNMTVFAGGSIAGPLLAGAMLPVLGLSTLYLLDAIALLATVWASWKLPAMPPSGDGTQRAGLRDVLAGFSYLAIHKVLLVSFLVDIIAMVAGMPRALFPEMAERTFGDPPGGGPALGFLFAGIAIGAALGGLFSGWLHRIKQHGKAVTIAICIWGVAMVGFGMAGQLWLAVLMLAIGGAADMVSAVYRSTMLQVVATDEMRGRMQGVFIVVVAGGPRLADVWHGAAGDAVGTGFAAAGGGVAVVVLTVLTVLVLPAFWRYRSPV